jgi:protein dithiol oxidoreductase (disulfide-forming)
MRRLAAVLLAISACFTATASEAQTWAEGQNYALVTPPQRTSVPAGKIEVIEVFSYGCPACNGFQPVMNKLKRALPDNVQFVLLPASFNASEDWPMFQRAYFAAQVLGIAERAHQAIFDAVWKSADLAVVVPGSNPPRLRNPQPKIQDAAAVYARVAGVKADAFLAAANSFQVDMKMRAADAQIAAMKVLGTPTIVVDGKYRVEMQSLHTTDELIELVKFLVAKAGGG